MILSRRLCKIGSSINARAERHGEESEPAMDIPIHILISAKELNEFMGNPHTADIWFETAEGELPKPFDKHLAARRLKGKFENSAAELWFGLKQNQLTLDAVTVSRVKLDPQLGGMTAVTLVLQTLINTKNNDVFLWMDREAECALHLGELTAADLQGDLDLQQPADANANAKPPAAVKPRSHRKKKPDAEQPTVN